MNAPKLEASKQVYIFLEPIGQLIQARKAIQPTIIFLAVFVGFRKLLQDVQPCVTMLLRVIITNSLPPALSLHILYKTTMLCGSGSPKSLKDC